MWRHHVLLALGLAWGASCLAPASAADPPRTSPPREVAKLPAPAPPAVAKQVQPPTATTAAGVKVAQLTYPVATTASAQDLLQAADDYAYYTDWVDYELYLRQVIALYPGTKEAGRALALLADQEASAGNAAEAEALTAILAAYADPEVQAFANLARTAYPAQRAKQFDVAEQAFAAYLDRYRDTASGGWAALRLGDLYRFGTEDYDKAVALYWQIVTESGSGAVVEEALVSLAETLNWSETARLAEAKATYERVMSTAQTPGIQVRALAGLGDMLSTAGEYKPAIQVFTKVIDSYPSHPSAALAHSLRSIAAENRGDWEMAVSDMRAYLTYPAGGQFMKARAHWILGTDALRRGHTVEAEAEFGVLAELADGSRHTAEFRGKAQAGLAGCAVKHGDLQGAMGLYLGAAGLEEGLRVRASYLLQAADVAEKLGAASRAQILARVVVEARARLKDPQLRPEDTAECHYVLGTAAFSEGDFGAARIEYQLMAGAGAPEALTVAGEQAAANCLVAKGDYAAASAEYEVMVAQHPGFPEYCAEARYQIGDILYRQARYQEASSHLGRVLSQYADTSWATVAKQRLAEIEAALASPPDDPQGDTGKGSI